MTHFFNKRKIKKKIEMIDDKLASRSFWVGELASSNPADHIKFVRNIFSKN